MDDMMKIETISQVHEMLGLDKPKHPLVSVIRVDRALHEQEIPTASFVLGFYIISFKAGACGELRYGRNRYDFQEGTILFMKPGQVLTFEPNDDEFVDGGWTLIFHPDLIRKSELGQIMDGYSFFSYEVHEALHLSDDEKSSLHELVRKIEHEYSQNIDRHTQKLIIANISLILDYCTRFYDRQFYVRTNLNTDLVTRFEGLISDYLTSDRALEEGIPSVKYCGEQLNMSPSYLSDLLKKETGRTAQQHIQDLVVDQAKNRLLASQDQVSQIAYDLGFEYPQHFSKMFKKHTGMSPAEYRRVH